MWHSIKHPAGIGSKTEFTIHVQQCSRDKHIVRAGGGIGKLARERVGCSTCSCGGHAGRGGERSGEGVWRREDGVVIGGEHQAELGERGEGVVTG
jgi:hypothetical protein